MIGSFTAVPPGEGYYGSVPIERQAPPSTYAVAAVLENEPGAFVRLVGVTGIRAVFIVPGIALGNWTLGGKLPWWKILVMGLLASTTISVGMLGWYGLKKLGTLGHTANLPSMSGT